MISPGNAEHGQILVPCLYKAYNLNINDDKKSQNLQLLLLRKINVRTFRP